MALSKYKKSFSTKIGTCRPKKCKKFSYNYLKLPGRLSYVNLGTDPGAGVSKILGAFWLGQGSRGAGAGFWSWMGRIALMKAATFGKRSTTSS
jgi:hypothetical protein